MSNRPGRLQVSPRAGFLVRQLAVDEQLVFVVHRDLDLRRFHLAVQIQLLTGIIIPIVMLVGQKGIVIVGMDDPAAHPAHLPAGLACLPQDHILQAHRPVAAGLFKIQPVGGGADSRKGGLQLRDRTP